MGALAHTRRDTDDGVTTDLELANLHDAFDMMNRIKIDVEAEDEVARRLEELLRDLQHDELEDLPFWSAWYDVGGSGKGSEWSLLPSVVGDSISHLPDLLFDTWVENDHSYHKKTTEPVELGILKGTCRDYSQPNSSSRTVFEGNGRHAMTECASEVLRPLEGIGDDMSLWSITTSCVLSSVQPFSKTMLAEAAMILALEDEVLTSQPSIDDRFTKLERILKYVRAVDKQLVRPESITVAETDGGESGYVTFKHPAMPDFLRNFRIDGIDASHKTLAKICLAALRTQPSDGEPNSSNIGKTSALVSYARNNWQHHCTAAASSSLALGIGQILPKAPGGGQGNLDFLPRRMKDMSMVDEDPDEDWTLVPNGGTRFMDPSDVA